MYNNEQMVLQAIDLYFKCGEKAKGLAMADRFMEETMQAIRLFAQPYRGSVLSQIDLQNNFQLYQYGITSSTVPYSTPCPYSRTNAPHT